MAAITDPISYELMRRPVALSCGHSLEETTAILAHGVLRDGLCAGRRPCSICRQIVTGYVPNHALRDLIERLLGVPRDMLAALPDHPLVVEGRRERIEVGAVPFPGIAARFEHTTGNWEPTNIGPRVPLSHFMHFYSPSVGSLFEEFSLLGYRSGNILIMITARSSVPNAANTIADYFQQLDIPVDWLVAHTSRRFTSVNQETTKKMLAVLALHNEIPAEYYERIRNIIENQEF